MLIDESPLINFILISSFDINVSVCLLASSSKYTLIGVMEFSLGISQINGSVAGCTVVDPERAITIFLQI